MLETVGRFRVLENSKSRLIKVEWENGTGLSKKHSLIGDVSAVPFFKCPWSYRNVRTLTVASIDQAQLYSLCAAFLTVRPKFCYSK